MTTATANKPVAAFPWSGGKWRLMPRLIPYIPDHRCYASMFGGSAADVLRKPRSAMEVFNDLDTDVVNFFQVMQEPADRRQLANRLLFTPYSRYQFGECLKVLGSDCDPIKRAWAFYYIATTGYTGQAPSFSTNGNFAINFKRFSSERWRDITRTLERIAARFQKVLIECRPWQEIVERYDSADTFFYADPPYIHSSRVSLKLYKLEMPDNQHGELLNRLDTIKGKAMISGYSSKIYEARLKHWRQVEFQTFCTMSSSRKKPKRSELIWMNYDEHGRKL